jgi:hypothetical protein
MFATVTSYPKPKIITGTIHIVISGEYLFIAKYQIIIPDTTKNTIGRTTLSNRYNDNTAKRCGYS